MEPKIFIEEENKMIELIKDKSRKSKIHAEIDDILAHNDGVINQWMIVERAHKEGTVLHQEFSKRGLFNPEKAMEFAQLTFARGLLMQYKVWVTVDDKEPFKVRALVNLKEDRKTKEGGYRPIMDVMSNEERRKKLLSDALTDMAIFRTKYQILVELEPVFEAMEKVKI